MDEIKKIKQYLEGAKTMESAAFTQRSIMDKLQQQINSMNFVKKTFSKPYKPTRRSPIRSFGEFLGIVGKSFIVPGCIYGAWFYYIASTPALTTKPLFIFYSMMTIAATALITFLIIAKKTADVSASYNEALRQYEKEMKRYEEDVEEEEERLKNLEKMKNYIISQGKEIGKTYKSTKSSLKQYYDASSIIYPKYHNMIAINQILEYLDSKRCSTLTGPDGAYNLYESELRMNQIIGNLDIIINSLDQIKTTQYMMYTEIKKSNEIAERIADSVESAACSLGSIQRSSAITAYNSQVMAANAQIIARNSF